jgi:carbon-monoxide dehydrogenase large subunit
MRHGNEAAATAAFAAAAMWSSSTSPTSAWRADHRAALGAGLDCDDGRLTLRMSSQMPSGVRNSLCNDILGLPREQVRVTVGDVGGGFGMKTGIYPEDAAVAWCRPHAAPPVKWIADRSEEFLTTAHGRDLQTQAEMALAADGKVLALRLRSLANVGAYATGTGVAIQLLIGPWVQTSVYDIQTIDFHFKAVLTNTAPTGAYRGAGRPEAIYIIERLMDEAARQTGMDRVALRRATSSARADALQEPDGPDLRHRPVRKGDGPGLALADWNGFDARAAQSRRAASCGAWASRPSWNGPAATCLKNA